MSRLSPPSLLILVAALSYGCGTTIRDAPKMSAAEVRWRGLDSLSPSTVNLEIVDARPARYREHSDALTQALAQQLGEILVSEGVQVDAASPHKLIVTVREVDEGLRRSFPEERCVSLHGRLERSASWFAEGEGFGCHSVRHVFGFTLGGNISEAYKVATTALLNTFQQSLERIERRNADALD